MTAELPSIPPRPVDGHKGSFGTVVVVGGQAALPRVMVGGPALTAIAALRAGTGLAILAMPAPLMAAGLTIAPSATGVPLPVDEQRRIRASDAAEALDPVLAIASAVALGPGLGTGAAQEQLVARLVGRDDVPLVIDADALNVLAEMRDAHRELRAPAVLTPHPGEYRRLAASMGVSHDPTRPGERAEAAGALARRLGCVVVLKGHRTVVSDGRETWTNETGSVALATAGTGDVLSGLIAGLVAQFFRPGFGERPAGPLSLLDCARLGVYVHGRAADHWSRDHGDAGLLAGELAERIPGVLAELRT
jgi:NAD(P)H-hydrate epimerase